MEGFRAGSAWSVSRRCRLYFRGSRLEFAEESSVPYSDASRTIDFDRVLVILSYFDYHAGAVPSFGVVPGLVKIVQSIYRLLTYIQDSLHVG